MPFLNPLGLALLGLGAPLAALYFLKLRRKRVEVPSILLWQEVIEAERLASPFDRFRKRWLMLLQLLVLALFAFALARPFLRGVAAESRALVLVLDISASMAATDVSPSRLDKAIDEARAVIDEMSGGDEAAIIAAGYRTVVTVPFTRDRARLRQALGELGPQLAEGGLDEALSLAASLGASRPHREVLVFSDGAVDDLGDISLAADEVEFVPVGYSDENTGIVSVDLRRSPTSTADYQLFVKIANFGREAASVSLAVEHTGRPLGTRTVELPPGSQEAVVFDGLPPESGVVSATLTAGGGFLTADDEAHALLQPEGRLRVLVVDGHALMVRALLSDTQLAVDAVASADYTGSSGYDVTIFNNWFPPEGAPGHAYLAFHPPATGGSASASPLPATFGPDQNNPRILSWARSHPSLRFLELSDLLVSNTRSVADRGLLAPIVEADTGPLVLAGVDQGARVLLTGFDSLASDLPLRVAFPLFLLNSVRWLGRRDMEAGQSHQVATGSVFSTQVAVDPTVIDDLRVIAPDGSERSGRLMDGMLRVADTDVPGIYRVATPTGPVSFAANLASEREGDIAPRSQLSLAETVQAGAATARSRREIWRPLALLGILLLVPEWWVWLRQEVQ